MITGPFCAIQKFLSLLVFDKIKFEVETCIAFCTIMEANFHMKLDLPDVAFNGQLENGHY